ncbi:hypothetical protein TWF970_007173 [Orbilia oligospora]|uniref:Uncharacterized protein n=1 Tax=Orbilia oligospora TaxID=2813651 RepID=A0A7C8VHL0_ORBOL|nr:hypothetical protein TWF970_007173 [Orbilia oligospora]
MRVAARQISLAILFCGTFAQKSTTITTIFVTTRWTETQTCSSQLQLCEDVIWNPLVSSVGNGTVGPSSWLPSNSIPPGSFSTFTTSRKTGSISTIASSYTENVTVPSWSSISTPTSTPSSFVLQSLDGDSPDSYFQLFSDGRLGLVKIAETSAPRFMLQGGRLLTVEEPVEAIFLRRGTIQKRQDAISLDDIGELLHDILESGEILSTDILSRIFFNEVGMCLEYNGKIYRLYRLRRAQGGYYLRMAAYPGSTPDGWLPALVGPIQPSQSISSTTGLQPSRTLVSSQITRTGSSRVNDSSVTEEDIGATRVIVLEIRAPALSTPEQLSPYAAADISTGCSSAVTSPSATSSFTETSVSEVSSTLSSTIDASGTYAADIPGYTGHLFWDLFGNNQGYHFVDYDAGDDFQVFNVDTDSGASEGYLRLVQRAPMGDGGSIIDVIVGIYSSEYLGDHPNVLNDYQTYLLVTKDDNRMIPIPVMWTSGGGVAIDKSSLLKAGQNPNDQRDTFWLCTDTPPDYVYVYSSVGLEAIIEGARYRDWAITATAVVDSE